MKSSLVPFEDYVTSLTRLGVYPTLCRNYNGWVCTLRNGVNTQIMPFEDEEQCWGETMLDALTVAISRLNNRYDNVEELHKYINTGVCRDIESILENIESLHLVKASAPEIDFEDVTEEEAAFSKALQYSG